MLHLLQETSKSLEVDAIYLLNLGYITLLKNSLQDWSHSQIIFHFHLIIWDQWRIYPFPIFCLVFHRKFSNDLHIFNIQLLIDTKYLWFAHLSRRSSCHFHTRTWKYHWQRISQPLRIPLSLSIISSSSNKDFSIR